MQLKVVGSSSKGNTYLLDNEIETLVIEAGCKLSEVKPYIDFDVNRLVGLIYSHVHNDHSKYAPDYSKNFIPVVSQFEHLKSFKLGNFTIKPFELFHDVETFGFLIHHPETGLVLFATDTSHIPYSFDGICTAIIEANYCEDIVYNRQFNQSLNAKLQDRINISHLSIQQVIEFLTDCDKSNLNKVVLIHLSDGSSNAKDFKEKVESAIGVQTFIADKGLIIDINKDLF